MKFKIFLKPAEEAQALEREVTEFLDEILGADGRVMNAVFCPTLVSKKDDITGEERPAQNLVFALVFTLGEKPEPERDGKAHAGITGWPEMN